MQKVLVTSTERKVKNILENVLKESEMERQNICCKKNKNVQLPVKEISVHVNKDMVTLESSKHKIVNIQLWFKEKREKCDADN